MKAICITYKLVDIVVNDSPAKRSRALKGDRAFVVNWFDKGSVKQCAASEKTAQFHSSSFHLECSAEP